MPNIEQPTYNAAPLPSEVIKSMCRGQKYIASELCIKFGCRESIMRELLRKMAAEGQIFIATDTDYRQRFFVKEIDKSDWKVAPSRYIPEFKALKGTEAARIQFMNNCLAIERRV